MKTIAIIGGGSTGINTAIFLHHFGFKAIVFETNEDILLGSSQASFILHSDGLEYYKQDHRTTGEQCIDGAITKHLIYPSRVFKSNISTVEKPIRFMVAESSVKASKVSKDEFYSNAYHMKNHYQQRYDSIKKNRVDFSEIGIIPSQHFARSLTTNECKDGCNGIAFGFAGSSDVISVTGYNRFLIRQLERAKIEIRCRQHIRAINKSKKGYIISASVKSKIYLVETDVRDTEVDFVILTAGHKIPELCEIINCMTFKPKGTYYLNGMTIFRLPKSSNTQILNYASRVNFTLQQENGCMYACIVPPTEKSDGKAAIYYPANPGSQLKLHDSFEEIPSSWETLIKKKKSPNTTLILEQAYRFYPFLKNYINTSHEIETIFRTVFNPCTESNDSGHDKRVREIVPGHRVTSDGLVISYTSPKWTNTELVALMAVHDVLLTFKKTGLKRFSDLHEAGFGPYKLDVEYISRNLHFRNQ